MASTPTTAFPRTVSMGGMSALVVVTMVTMLAVLAGGRSTATAAKDVSITACTADPSGAVPLPTG